MKRTLLASAVLFACTASAFAWTDTDFKFDTTINTHSQYWQQTSQSGYSDTIKGKNYLVNADPTSGGASSNGILLADKAGSTATNKGLIYVKVLNGYAQGMGVTQADATIINDGKIYVDNQSGKWWTRAKGMGVDAGTAINNGEIFVQNGNGIVVNSNEKSNISNPVVVKNLGSITVSGKGAAFNSEAKSYGVLVNEGNVSILDDGTGFYVAAAQGGAIENSGSIVASNKGSAITGLTATQVNLSGNSHIEGKVVLSNQSSLAVKNLTSVNETLDIRGVSFEGKTLVPTDDASLKNLSLNNSQIGLIGNGKLTTDTLSVTGANSQLNLLGNKTLETKKVDGSLTISSDHLANKGALVTVGEANKAINVKFAPNVTDSIKAENAQAIVKEQVNVQNGQVSTTFTEGLQNGEIVVDANGTHVKANTVQQATLEMVGKLPVTMTRVLTNDVRKRLGDIRSAEQTHGAWIRYDGGKLSGENNFSTDFHTVQLGMDTVPTEDAARMGVAFSYTKGESEFGRGQSDLDAYTLAAYGTWVGDNGMFADVIGRMGTAKNDMSISHNGATVKGQTDNVVLSLSGEMGWRLPIMEMMYVEPQAELTYTYINSDSFKLDNAKYAVDSTTSLIGRAGFAAGLKCPSNKGDVYFRASAVHEFLGDSSVTVNDLVTTELDGKDTWFEYGIGANFNVAKNAYIWADVERTDGAELDEDWRATVGVRYAW